MKVIKYGPGGRDASKPDDNIREERELPEPTGEEKAKYESRRNPQEAP
jgi:hypothetical protein